MRSTKHLNFSAKDGFLRKARGFSSAVCSASVSLPVSCGGSCSIRFRTSCACTPLFCGCSSKTVRSPAFCFFFEAFSFCSFIINSSKISSEFVTSLAPNFIKSFVPLPFVMPKSLGIQYTFFFCSKPYLPVIVLPLLYPASITNIAFDIPLIILFRLGKFCLFISSSGPYSEIMHPLFFNISSNYLNVSFKLHK